MDENPGKPPEWVTLVGLVPRFDGLGVVYGLRLPKERVMGYCCKEFAEQAGELQAPVGGGMYPDEMRPSAQFEPDDDGTWNINGCCGGGCFVVTNMRFCPYCGTKLEQVQ